MALGPPNMASTVASFSTPYTRRRFPAPTVNSSGLDVQGTPVDVTIQVHLFESGGGPERLPEGVEIGRVMEGHAVEDQGVEAPILRAADEQSGAPPDQILVGDGDVLEVFEVNDFREGPAGAVAWRQVFAARVVNP